MVLAHEVRSTAKAPLQIFAMGKRLLRRERARRDGEVEEPADLP